MMTVNSDLVEEACVMETNLVEEADGGVPLFREPNEGKVVADAVLRFFKHGLGQLHVVGAPEPEHHLRHAALNSRPVEVDRHGFLVLGQDFPRNVALHLGLWDFRDFFKPVRDVSLD